MSSQVDMALDDVVQGGKSGRGGSGAMRNSRRVANRGARAAAPYQRPYGAKRSIAPDTGKRVYVGNISWEAQWQELKDHMRGPNQDLNVTHADIMPEANGRSKGCAIVEYATVRDAQRAIAELNDTDLMGRLIFVREDREGGAVVGRAGVMGGAGGGQASGKRVYVGNISWEAQWQELKDHMRGPNQDLNVTHADIMPEANGRSKGCAIVEYATVRDAQRAIAELNDTDLMGRLIFVREDREGGAVGGGGGGQRATGSQGGNYGGRVSNRGGGQASGKRVYVGNISWEAQWQELKDHMRGPNQDLNVTHADIMPEANGRSKGCAIVEYATVRDAQRAIAELNDTDLMGRLIFVREDREA